MNKERLLAVADAIEKEEIAGLGFDMANWFGTHGHTCGTSACIAGHVIAKYAPHLIKSHDVSIPTEAREILGAQTDEDTLALNKLFYGIREDDEPSVLTDLYRGIAVIAIRRLAETGVTNWDEAERLYYCDEAGS